MAFALVFAVLMLLSGVATAATGCWIDGPLGCASVSADLNEPNDELQSATVLVADMALDASISKGGSKGDADVFRSDVPRPGESGRFRVEIRSDRAEDLLVEVGASIPGVFEAISWPGWEPKTTDGPITVDGRLQTGTVIIFVSGEKRADYSIRIVWD